MSRTRTPYSNRVNVGFAPHKLEKLASITGTSKPNLNLRFALDLAIKLYEIGVVEPVCPGVVDIHLPPDNEGNQKTKRLIIG